MLAIDDVGDGRSCPPKKGAAAMEGEGTGDGNLAEKSGIRYGALMIGFMIGNSSN